MPSPTDERPDLLPKREDEPQLPQRVVGLDDETEHDRILHQLFQRSYMAYSKSNSMSNLLRIAYEEMIKVASFQFYPYQPDARAFLVDLLNSEIDGSRAYVGKEKDPNYWQNRAREEHRLLESCRLFLKRIAPAKEIMSKATANWFINLNIAVVIMVRTFFMKYAKQVCEERPISYLLHFQTVLERMYDGKEEVLLIMEYNPEEFILICLDKLTTSDFEHDKKVDDIRRGARLAPEAYLRLMKLKESIEKRYKDEIFERPVIHVDMTGEDQVDAQNIDTSDSSIGSSETDEDDDEGFNSQNNKRRIPTPAPQDLEANLKDA